MRMMMTGLKLRFLVVILGVCLVTATLAFFACQRVVERVAERLGVAYAGQYALANRALLQEPLARETALARQMADSPALRDWAMDEANPRLRDAAFALLENYRVRLAEGTWFCVVAASRRYYYDDSVHRYGDSRLAYTLSADNPKDAWYFATLRDVKEYALNVNYDRALDTRKVWINVVVRQPDGKPLAVVGTGLDLSGFLREFIDRAEPGVENVIIDQRLAIQAHRNRDWIDLQSVAKPVGEHSTVDRMLTGANDVAHLRAALDRLREGSRSERLFVTADGKRQLLGVTYLADLKWYVLTFLDVQTVIARHVFGPIFGLIALMTLALLAVVAWIVNRMVLTPLAGVTTAARRLAGGDYTRVPPSRREDEIGDLARAFAQMQTRIREDRDLLESRVQERTAQADEANRTLRERAAQLEEALAKVRTLSGLLPMCSACRKIRDDRGYWSQLEQYVSKHTDTRFSHGLCPDCARRLYPDDADAIEAEPPPPAGDAAGPP